MPAPKGNQFWKARAKSGRDKIFKDSDALWSSACEYFQWVEDNPLWEMKPFKVGDQIVQEPIAKMRAMTLDGLWLFLGISDTTWYDYKAREDFMVVIKQIENVVRSQKFAGAAADLLNANIIARDLGLSDKNEITGKNGGPVETSTKVEWVIQPVKPVDEA